MKEENLKPCCTCGIDCGEQPEIVVIQGVVVSHYFWFCSKECYIEAIKVLLKEPQTKEEKTQ